MEIMHGYQLGVSLIKGLIIVSTRMAPSPQPSPPKPGGEGRVRGVRTVNTISRRLINHVARCRISLAPRKITDEKRIGDLGLCVKNEEDP